MLGKEVSIRMNVTNSTAVTSNSTCIYTVYSYITTYRFGFHSRLISKSKVTEVKWIITVSEMTCACTYKTPEVTKKQHLKGAFSCDFENWQWRCSMTCCGRLFQTCVPVTITARSPTVNRHVWQVISDDKKAGSKCRQASKSAGWCSLSARYNGADGPDVQYSLKYWQPSIYTLKLAHTHTHTYMYYSKRTEQHDNSLHLLAHSY